MFVCNTKNWDRILFTRENYLTCLMNNSKWPFKNIIKNIVIVTVQLLLSRIHEHSFIIYIPSSPPSTEKTLSLFAERIIFEPGIINLQFRVLCNLIFVLDGSIILTCPRDLVHSALGVKAPSSFGFGAII